MEATKAKELFPDAHFASLHSIVGIKNKESQDPKDWKHKGRIVFGGHRVLDSSGKHAIFDDISNTPSSMAACRIAVACAAADSSLELLQSDCIRAYPQAAMTGPPTFVRLPKAWWPSHWSGYTDPVCRLDKALYGHPKAGDIWHECLAAALAEQSFRPVEGWPSVFEKDLPDGGIMLVIAYVDDLLFLGSKGMREEIATLRKRIKMDDPTVLSKYLGCNHHFNTKSVGGETVTTVEYDMMDYFREACSIYKSETGLSLKSVDSPYAPDLPSGQLDKLLESAGRFADKAASFLMKLLYGARMAGPWLTVAIMRLARQIHKWNAECDRRLHRLYCYIDGTVQQVLTGVLSTGDRKSLKIDCWPDADLCGDIFSTKSTSGRFIELSGLEGRGMPLTWAARRQGSTSKHTQEAETVSLSTCLCEDAIPIQALVERILRTPVPMVVHEDNTSAITAVRKGYSPALRHLPRTQRICLGSLHEMFTEQSADDGGRGNIELVHAETATHKGDMFTKDMPPKAYREKVALLRVVNRGQRGSA